MSGGKQDGHRGALGDPDQGGPLNSRGLHDRADVIHPLLERGHALDRVGEAYAALVEVDDAAERRQAAEKPCRARELPG
jgi:hypothetical protein